MTNIALDTNIWIYLTKDTSLKFWEKFKEMKINNEIRIIINDVILTEWKRNKMKTIKALSENIKNEFNSAFKLSNYLSGEIKETYIKTIFEYKDEKFRIEKAEARVEEVETFMKSCTIIKVSDEQKLFISDLAIYKLPPMHSSKNNFNDALIVKNICEFVGNEMPFLYDLIYVSNNPNDFIDVTTKTVYESIGIPPIRLKNVTELGEALNLAPEYCEDFDGWLDQKLDDEAMYQLDIMRGK